MVLTRTGDEDAAVDDRGLRNDDGRHRAPRGSSLTAGSVEAELTLQAWQPERAAGAAGWLLGARLRSAAVKVHDLAARPR